MKIWIIPVNDLEAVEIRNLLQAHGQTVVTSQQRWGARWENLEAGVVAQVENLLQEHPNSEVIGVELGGIPRWNGRNIDHHRYGEGDRTNESSSLEQVATELGVGLNRYLQLVAANDKGWIPALQATGAKTGEVDAVRQSDRCAQGVTPDDEAQAVRDLASAEWRGRKVLVHCPKGSTSAHTDRLYGQFDECLTCGPDKWIYFGPRHHQLHELVHSQSLGNERDWVGGKPESGYAGFVTPSEAAQDVIRSFFWQE